jgi:carboxyl-terminal processing protease
LLKLTTAKWYTPNGKSIDEKGIEPDVIISLTDDDYKNAYDRQLEGAKKLLQYQIEKSISLEELKKEADTILNE